MNLEPDEGFSLRAVTVPDAEAVADVINECTRTEIGLPWTTPEEVRNEWQEGKSRGVKGSPHFFCLCFA